MEHADVIRLAKEAHSLEWRMTGNAGAGDRLAAAVTSRWQSSVLEKFPGRFVKEHRVGGLAERIDLVDIVSGVAYELKVSPNNDHFEFYRDIFKVLVARDQGLTQIAQFCFICPVAAANRYERGLRRSVLDMGARFGISLSVAAI